MKEEKTQYFPMFPLGLLLLPGEQTQLHIFEHRYRQLVEDVENGDGRFVIPFVQDKDKFSLGCVVDLLEVVKRYESGESDIMIECREIVRIKTFDAEAAGKLYAGGNAKIIGGLKDWRAGEELMEEFVQMKIALGPKAKYLNNLEYSYVLHIFSFLNVNSEDKFKFLSQNDRAAMERQITQMVRFGRLILEQEKEKEHGFFMN